MKKLFLILNLILIIPSSIKPSFSNENIDLSFYILKNDNNLETVTFILNKAKLNWINKRFFKEEIQFPIDLALDISLRKNDEHLLVEIIKRLEQSNTQFPLEQVLSTYLKDFDIKKTVNRSLIITGSAITAYYLYHLQYLLINYKKLTQKYYNIHEAIMETCFYSVLGLPFIVSGILNAYYTKINNVIIKRILSSPIFYIKDKNSVRALLKILQTACNSENCQLITTKLESLA